MKQKDRREVDRETLLVKVEEYQKLQCKLNLITCCLSSKIFHSFLRFVPVFTSHSQTLASYARRKQKTPRQRNEMISIECLAIHSFPLHHQLGPLVSGASVFSNEKRSFSTSYCSLQQSVLDRVIMRPNHPYREIKRN